jgi:hypothetical protein
LQKSRGSAGGAPSPERFGASADSPAGLDRAPVLQDAAKLAALLSDFCKRLDGFWFMVYGFWFLVLGL